MWRPVAAFGVDGRAVGDAAARRHVDEGAPVGDAAGGGVEIVGPDRAGMAVGEIHGAAVGAPGERVGAADAVDHLMDGMVGVEPVERADEGDRLTWDLEHGARPEPALAVRLAVVEAGLWPAGLGIGDRLEAAAVGIE